VDINFVVLNTGKVFVLNPEIVNQIKEFFWSPDLLVALLSIIAGKERQHV
jgi:uncharacterized protein YlzI (FlbEa/FlbD family)